MVRPGVDESQSAGAGRQKVSSTQGCVDVVYTIPGKHTSYHMRDKKTTRTTHEGGRLQALFVFRTATLVVAGIAMVYGLRAGPFHRHCS